jgi:AAA domain/Primase C terminal 2 (PriCT-2)
VKYQSVTNESPTDCEGHRQQNAVPNGPRNGASVSPHARQLDSNGPENAGASLQVSGHHESALPTSPLDRELTLTQFRDAGAKRAFRHLVPLRGLAPKIETRRAERKDRLPWLKLATFGDRPTGKGSLRNNANVTAIDGIEGDHDSGALTPAEAADRLQRAGIAALIYTSPSHTPARPRWRVLAPLSRSMPPDHRERLCARLQGVLGGALAPESFALSQAYYYGGVDGGTVPETLLIEGAALDTLDRLDAGALDKRGKPYASVGPDHFMHVPPSLLEPSQDDDDDLDIRAAPSVEKIRAALAAIPAEARDDREGVWRPVGMALHHEFGRGESGFNLWDEWSATSAKHDARDQRRVWESFGKGTGKAIAIGTLYALADQHGPAWRQKAVAPRAASRLQLFTPAECTSAAPRGYVIKRLIAPGDVACVFGAPGGGKSTLAPYLGYQVARGEHAFGLRTKAGTVLYVAAEDVHGMKNRVKALRLQLGDADRFYVIDGVSDLLDAESPDLAALRAIVDDKRPALIFIDTLAMSFRDLEENDAASMNKVVAIARSLTEQGAAVVLIHHGTKAEGSTPRGHSVLNGALDVAVQLLPPDTDGIIRGRLSKNRNGACDLDIAFRVASEELGKDEDGDPITAAIVDALPAGSVPRRKPLPDAHREALAMLVDLETDGPVTEDAWRDACIDSRRVSQSEERDSRKKAFNRAKTGLYRAGVILLSDDRVSVARQPVMDWPDDDDMEEGE